MERRPSRVCRPLFSSSTKGGAILRGNEAERRPPSSLERSKRSDDRGANCIRDERLSSMQVPRFAVLNWRRMMACRRGSVQYGDRFMDLYKISSIVQFLRAISVVLNSPGLARWRATSIRSWPNPRPFRLCKDAGSIVRYAPVTAVQSLRHQTSDFGFSTLQARARWNQGREGSSTGNAYSHGRAVEIGRSCSGRRHS